MKILKPWATTIVCGNCGVTLEVEVNDIRVKLILNYGQTGNLSADKIPEYSTRCGGCGRKVKIQEGFTGELPEKIKNEAEKKSRVSLDKIRYDMM